MNTSKTIAMPRTLLNILAVAALGTAVSLGAGGCGESGGGSGSNDAADSLTGLDVEIPSVEEADADAALEITEENADAVLESLEAELDAELDDELDDGG